MERLLLSAFACDPTKGSESANGWNWAVGLAQKNYDVHCFTRINNKESIKGAKRPPNLKFYYIGLGPLERLFYASTIGMYMYYLIWQWFAYRKAKTLQRKLDFKLAHHVTWGNYQIGSFMYKLGIPFIFGPAGGGQKAPVNFRSYFGRYWEDEEKRERTSQWMIRYSPACKGMIREAHAVLVSNPDTYKMVQKIGAKNIITTLDAALPESFFPKNNIIKRGIPGELKLLWVGRFLPRKGIMLLLDVMKELKKYPGISLTVVGDGEMRKTFLDGIRDYQLENTVNWKGKVPYEQVTGFYASHDVFFFTSLRDSCPAQLIEAMAFAQPIVTLNLHGQSVIVSDNTGFRCACDTPDIAISELKKAILYLYNNPKKIEEMGKAARSFAKEQTWERKIENIVKTCYPN